MTAQLDTLTRSILANESEGLIRAEIHALERRAKLERAIVEVVTKLGCSVDEVSEATGLTPTEIRKLIARPPELDEDLAALSGTA